MVIFVIGLALMALIFIPSFIGYYYYYIVYVQSVSYYHFYYINRIYFSWVLLIVGAQMIICKLFFVSNDSADLKTVIIDNRLVIYCMYFI